MRPGDDDFDVPAFSNGCAHLAIHIGDGVYDQVGLFVQDGACGYLAASGDAVGGANAAETAWWFGKSLDTLYRAPICAHVSQVLQREAAIAANNYWVEEGLPYR